MFIYCHYAAGRFSIILVFYVNWLSGCSFLSMGKYVKLNVTGNYPNSTDVHDVV